MRIYWYQPSALYPESKRASGVLLPGDSLTIHSLSSRRGVPLTGSPSHYQAVRELPDVAPVGEGSLRWIPSRFLTYTKRARLRRQAVSAGKYDICHIFALNYFTDAWALGRLDGCRALVSTVHDVVPHESRVPTGLQNRLLRRMYQSAGALVVAHESLRRTLIDRFDLASDRVEVIPLPVDEIVDINSEPPPSPLTVLFFGHFRRNKGVSILLEAIRRIPSSDVRFVFAGRGVSTLEQEVLRAAQEDQRIEAEIGFVPKHRMSELFAESHLAVLPYTTFASQSGVLGDAYAHLVPVVASDVGALGETIRADASGWVVPAGDPEALAGALGHALIDREGRARARRGMHQARLARSYEAVGRAHRRLYARLLDG